MFQVRIHKEDFVHLAPSRPGSVRVNHNDGQCSGDSKSLIITRKPDESISCYCFRCGGTGYYSGGRSYSSPDSIREKFAGVDSHVDEATGIYLPGDITTALPDFPQAVRAWLSKAGITATGVETAGIVWSDTTQMLYLPVVQETSAFGPVHVGFVQRLFDPKRYLTLTKDKDRFYGFLRASEGHMEGRERRVVLVEDIISGLRMREICDTLVLCGTELRPHAMNLLIKEGYRKATVFLDADNPTVKMKARKIAKKLSWMDVSIIETGNDPKHYSATQLEKLIHES